MYNNYLLQDTNVPKENECQNQTRNIFLKEQTITWAKLIIQFPLQKKGEKEKERRISIRKCLD